MCLRLFCWKINRLPSSSNLPSVLTLYNAQSRLMKSSPTAWRLHELIVAVVYWEVTIVRCFIDLCKYISWSHLATKSLSTLQLGQYYNHSKRQACFQMVILNNRINCATHPYRSLLWSTIDVVDNLQSFTELISTFKGFLWFLLGLSFLEGVQKKIFQILTLFMDFYFFLVLRKN